VGGSLASSVELIGLSPTNSTLNPEVPPASSVELIGLSPTNSTLNPEVPPNPLPYPAAVDVSPSPAFNERNELLRGYG
jgi:hypothetical protein